MIKECPVCGIKQIDGVFYWSHGNKPANPDEIMSKVCTVADAAGRDTSKCINTEGNYDESLAYREALPSIDI